MRRAVRSPHRGCGCDGGRPVRSGTRRECSCLLSYSITIVPLRNREVDTRNERLPFRSRDLELRDQLRATVIAQDLDEQRLHVALSRAALRVPLFEHGAHRRNTAQPSSRMADEDGLHRRERDQTLPSRQLARPPRGSSTDGQIEREVEDGSLGRRDRNSVDLPHVRGVETPCLVNRRGPDAEPGPSAGR